MLQHIVMWKFKESADGKNKSEIMEEVRSRLLALPAIIPEIKFMQLGRDVSGTEMSFDMVLVTRFDSREALETYRVHPAHQAVSAYVKTVRTARAVLDAEMDENGEMT